MKNFIPKLQFLVLLLAFLISGTYELNAQTVATFTTTGANNWTCPTGVTSIQFEAYGGGGGGGGGNSGGNKRGGGGGGGGGYAIHTTVPVTPGTTYVITVGTGGNGGATSGNGTNGSLSRGVFGGLTITANGGNGGAFFSGGTGVSGSGGTATNGTTNRTGGAGGTGATTGSGGGGGGAGTTGAGGAGGAGGTTTAGANGGGQAGDGGAARNNNTQNGQAGSNYGGGGSGGTNTGTGGAGAQGYAVITYTAPAPANSTCATAITLPCASGSVSGTTVSTTGVAHGIPTVSTSNYGVWYTFVGDGQQTTITAVAGAGFDHEMTIASGACGSLTYINSYDSGVSGGTETTTFIATSGVTYYVYIAYYGATGVATDAGTFTISRTCVAVTPPVNDECGGALAVTVNGNTACGTTTAGTVNFATASGQALGLCGGTADDDVWFNFTATGSAHNVGFTGATGSTTDLMISVYSGTCASLTQMSCAEYFGSGTSVITGLSAGQSYKIRIFSYSSSSQNTTFNVCVGTPPAAPANDECAGAYNLTVNPFGSCATQTAGTVANALPSIVPMGSCFGTADDDVWFRFTATSSTHGLSLNNITGSTSDMYFSVYSGTCAALGTPITCSDPETGNVSGLTIGNTYYVRVYSYTSLTGQTSAFNVCVSAPAACPANMGSGTVNVASLPYSISGENLNATAANDFTSTNVVTCGSNYYFDNYDKVYVFTPTTTGSITVTVNSATSYLGATLFEGCPFSGNCVSYVQNSNTGAKNFCTSVVAGTTYYLVVDAWNTTTNMSYSVNITAPSAGTTNDLPCNATTIFNGVSVSGSNICTNSSGEPAATPACWTSGTINSVWYKFTATSSSMYLQTTLTTIPSTQIAVYTGTCGASLAYFACNQDAGSTGCSGSTQQNSLLDMTTLTVGQTYYVRLDGEYEDVGTFNIILNDGTSSTTNDPILGQDCMNPVPVCTNVVNVANPSYAGTGNICDFLGTSDCTSGEKNSVWYTFEIGTTGGLNFSIKPNDAVNSDSGNETDYDWVLWKVRNADGTSNTSCATLDAAAPASCNYGFVGITGISPGGTTPAPFTGANDAYFEPTLSVTAGEIYVLVVQNFETSSSGFNLNFSTSSAGVIDATPSTIYWNGAANTDFTNVGNYGACSVAPACGINVVINNSGFQPTISGTTTYCRDLTINTGATLTFAANSTLYICGTLTNNGTIICPVSSTIVFVDGSNTTQYINGNFSGTTNNRFGNLTVTKAAGSVILNTNINIGGNFLTSNSTSVFNNNSKYVKLAGHFTNATGNTTYTNTGTTAGTLEFNGTGAQNYNQGSSQLDLNFVIANNTAAAGAGINLITNMFIKATTGTLTLTAGTITTGGTSTTTGNKVHVLNTAPTSVSTGNTSSFVDGNLRRYVTTSGDYNWPVGNVAKGYQRAQTVFSATAGMVYIDSRFDVWPLTCTTNATECGTTYDQPTENNGFWTMIPDAGTCTYDCTLYPVNATNTAGMSAWTIIKRPHTTAIDNTGWILNGTCVASTATVVKRNAMTNFSFLGVDQALTPLPIELIAFDGYAEETYNIINWTTSSERDNDFFTLEKSADGINFSFFKSVDGAGNSTVKTTYEVFDYTPYASNTYYRLKQTNFDGNETYFNTILVKNSVSEFKLTNIHPNPVNDILNVTLDAPQKGIVTYRLVDNAGRIVQTNESNVHKGMNTIQIDMNATSQGVYNLEVIFNNTDLKQIEKIIKQ